MGTPKSDAIRQQVSEGFRAYTEDAEARGVTYKLGVKDGTKQIDCSGFVEKAVRRVFDGYLTNGEKLEIRNNKSQTHVFDCGADDQISEIARKTGVLLKGDDVNLKSIKEGMIIGLDTGPVSWAGDRSLWNNISHIVLVYKDPKSGELMVGQSSGTGHGVNSKPLKDWYKQVHGAGISLYATDVAKLAENIGAQPVDNSQREVVAKAVQAGAGVAKSFMSAFPDVSGQFSLAAPRAEKAQTVPGVRPLAPGQQLKH